MISIKLLQLRCLKNEDEYALLRTTLNTYNQI